MQLSLPSVPADSGTSSLLTGLPGAADSTANGAAANDPGVTGGFAQMLAGCTAPGNGAIAPAGVVAPTGLGAPGVVTPATITTFTFAEPGAAPVAAVVGPLVAGQLAPVAPQTLPDEEDSSTTADAGDEITPSDGPRAKDLTALGDLQTLASLVTAMQPATVAIAGSPSPDADDGVNQAEPEVATAGGDFAPSSAAQPMRWAEPRAGVAAALTARDPRGPSFAVAPDGAVGRMPVSSTTSPAVSSSLPTEAMPAAAERPAYAAMAPAPVDAAASAPAPSATGGAPSSTLADPAVAPSTEAARAPALEQARAVAVQPQAAEKIAGAGADTVRRTDRAGTRVDAKSFVATVRKGLTRFDPGLGIDTAKPAATMPDGATPDRKTSSDPVVPTSAPVSESRVESTLPTPVALTSTAHRAVEAALATADRFSARDQHAVTLQFSVGGNPLNVRVELRAGEVHTTFRTDSADLRAALSSEWQAVTSPSSAERPMRLAAPVFTSANDSGASFSGDGATRQHQQESAHSGSHSGPPSFRGPSRGTDTGASVAATTVAPVRAAANSVHLHTLA